MNVSKQLSGEHNNVGQMAVSPPAGDKQQCRDKPVDKLFLFWPTASIEHTGKVAFDGDKSLPPFPHITVASDVDQRWSDCITAWSTKDALLHQLLCLCSNNLEIDSLNSEVVSGFVMEMVNL